jgi:hypothetical protein
MTLYSCTGGGGIVPMLQIMLINSPQLTTHKRQKQNVLHFSSKSVQRAADILLLGLFLDLDYLLNTKMNTTIFLLFLLCVFTNVSYKPDQSCEIKADKQTIIFYAASTATLSANLRRKGISV